MVQTLARSPTQVNLRGGVRLELSVCEGCGTPIVLLHEGLGSASMWKDFPSALAAATGRQVLAWSRLGHGWSDSANETFAPDYMHKEAELLLETLDDLGIRRAVLFGHSDGASIALIAAASRPERVAAMILEAPHVLVEQITIDAIAGVRELFEKGHLRQALAKYHRDPDMVFWRWSRIWLDTRFRNWNIEGLLAHVRAPTLLIQGRDDEYGSMDQLDRIQAVVPLTQRVELENCGHSPHRDCLDLVIECSTVFLRNQSGIDSR